MRKFKYVVMEETSILNLFKLKCSSSLFPHFSVCLLIRPKIQREKYMCAILLFSKEIYMRTSQLFSTCVGLDKSLMNCFNFCTISVRWIASVVLTSFCDFTGMKVNTLWFYLKIHPIDCRWSNYATNHQLNPFRNWNRFARASRFYVYTFFCFCFFSVIHTRCDMNSPFYYRNHFLFEESLLNLISG